MRRNVASTAALVLALVLATTAPAPAHDTTPTGPQVGSLVFADPAPAGISYEWTLRMPRRQGAQLVYAVGAKSWSEPSNPDGRKGWTHTSNWVALELPETATVKITVERQQGVVVVTDGVAAAARFALVPALSVYRGWDDTTEVEDHTFNNLGNFWSTIVYLGSAANPKAKPKVVYRAKLAAGRYSVVIGGNPRSLGDPSAYPAATCDPSDPVCYQYTGQQGYLATIETR